jgi:Ca2+-transporting ATPase
MRQMALGLVQGAVVLAAVLASYAWMLGLEVPVGEARALAFIMLVAGNLSLAFADSAERETAFFNRRRTVFFGIAAAAVLAVAAVTYLPPLAQIFKVSPPSLAALCVALPVAVLAGGWFGLYRRFWGHSTYRAIAPVG